MKKEVILYGLDRNINLAGVSIDRQNNKLLVCSADGLAYLYVVHIPVVWFSLDDLDGMLIIHLMGVSRDQQNNKLLVCSVDGLAYLSDVHIPDF